MYSMNPRTGEVYSTDPRMRNRKKKKICPAGRSFIEHSGIASKTKEAKGITVV
jgi:hypothetical protein